MTSDGDGAWVARFDACERDPRFAEAMSRQPRPSPVSLAPVLFPALFLIFFLAVGGFILRQFLRMAPLPMVLFAIGVVGFGAVVVGGQIFRPFLKARSTGDVERCLAVIASVGDRHAVLAFRNRKQRRVALAGDAAPRVGDIGVAHVRDGRLADFVSLG